MEKKLGCTNLQGQVRKVFEWLYTFFQWKILGLENIISLRIFGVKTRQQTEISHKNQESINHWPRPHTKIQSWVETKYFLKYLFFKPWWKNKISKKVVLLITGSTIWIWYKVKTCLDPMLWQICQKSIFSGVLSSGNLCNKL